MTSAATPAPGGPSPASPAGGSESAPSTTVRIRPDVAALPAYVPGARPDAAGSVEIAKLSSNELWAAGCFSDSACLCFRLPSLVFVVMRL